MPLDPRIVAVTDRVIARSRDSRAAYLALIEEERDHGVDRPRLSCGNFAHGFAASGEDKKAIIALVACVGGSWIVPGGTPDLNAIHARALAASTLGKR